MVEVEVLTPGANVESVDHWTVYAGEAKPDPVSVEALQLQVGVVSRVGEVVVGVPGLEGLVVSTLTVLAEV